jgi:hypothetical protein
MDSKETRETFEWIGVEGERYTYYVHDLPTDFDSGKLGNYIFARKGANGNWIPIYIGQGDLSVQTGHFHPQLDCIKELGATHVHVHPNDSEWVRMSEEHDLLESYSKVFEPYGCNFKEEEQREEKIFEL